MNAFPWLTLLTVLPVAGALIVLSFGGRNKNVPRWLALIFSFVALALTLIAMVPFQFRLRRTSISANCPVDFRAGRRVSRWHRRARPPDAASNFHCCSHRNTGVVADSKAGTALFFSGIAAAGMSVRHIHRVEFLPLVHFLGTQPDPRILPD